jgi:hypothetical protein
MFAIALVAFVACTALFSVGVSLAIFVVGLFILVGCLAVAGWSARLVRLLLGYAGVSLPPAHYPAPATGFWSKLRRLADGQSWRDLIFVLVNFVLSTASFSIAISWVVSGPAGITYWFWSRFLPDDDHGLPELLGFGSRFADVAFHEIVGVIMLLTAPLVLHGLVRLHGVVARGLLVNETSALREQVSVLASSRTAAGEAEAHTLRNSSATCTTVPSNAWCVWAWTSRRLSAAWMAIRNRRGLCWTRRSSSRKRRCRRSVHSPAASPHRSLPSRVCGRRSPRWLLAGAGRPRSMWMMFR